MSHIPRLILSGSLCLLAAPAFAHIQLDFPTARTTSQKTTPCGAAGSVRGENVTRLKAGDTLIVRWRETINHPGHYRISFDDDGQDDFVEPASFADFYTNDSVLHDNIADKSGGDYTFEMTVPNVTCTNCTLQVVQVMTDKAPYGDGNDLYYQCADLEIYQDGDDVGNLDMGTSDMGSDIGLDMDTPDPPLPSNNTVPDVGLDDDHDHEPEQEQNPIEGEGSTCSSVGTGFAMWSTLLAFLGFRRRKSRSAA